jgi:prepilin-type N-terminal cleavage/methylation domain-containing protein
MHIFRQLTTRIRRPGFTLPEVLVTVSMVAILAAAVVPAVVGQLQKADVGRIGDDALAVQGAVQQFAADVRKLPANIGELTSPIGISLAAFPAGAGGGFSFTSTDVIHWKGPYLNKDSVAARMTAYNDSMVGVFALDTLGVTGVVSAAGGTRYVTLLIPNVDAATAALLDNLYDNGNVLSGFIRYNATGRDTLKVLLVPVQ